MKSRLAERVVPLLAALAATAMLPSPARAQAAAAASAPVYRCPGPPIEYTDQLTPQQARDKGCRTIEGAPITIIQGLRRPPPANGASAAAPARPAEVRPAESRVDPAAQRARDNDARRILGDELRRAEEQLAALQREYNNGEPERRGDERNYQKYLDRVADLKAGIARKEADIAALKRELAKLGP